MICELCGITAKDGFKVKVLGSVISSCPNCAKGKEKVSDVSYETKKPKPVQRREKPKFDVSQEFDLVEDYPDRVRRAREKRKWTQEDLGKKVNESHSVIHRIELGKYEPRKSLTKSLEKELGIKLMVKHAADEDQQLDTEKKDLTLGDMIVVRRKKK